MTLSRYDEWSGTFGENNNQNANYGLYAFRNPSTPYQRAYWHPGVGIWQYDSAGLGAPFTAIESMRVSTVAGASLRPAAGRPASTVALAPGAAMVQPVPVRPPAPGPSCQRASAWAAP